MHGMPVTEMGFTATIGSGETHDLLLTADNKRPVYGKYILQGPGRLCSQIAKLETIDPTLIAQIPAEPVDCENTNYVNYVELCQEGDFFPQFYPMHNHDDYKVTNTNTLANPVISMYPGGQLTFIQTDAPAGR